MEYTRSAEERDGQGVLGLLVLEIGSGHALGKLQEVGIDVSRKAVSDLVVEDPPSGRRGDRRVDRDGGRLPFQVVEAFGPEAVTVWSGRTERPAGPAPPRPVTESASRVDSEPFAAPDPGTASERESATESASSADEGRVPSSQLVGRPVYSADGRKLGDVEDIRFHVKDGRLTGLLLASGQRRRGSFSELLPAEQIRVVGPDVVVAEVSAALFGREGDPRSTADGVGAEGTDTETRRLERGLEETLARAEELSRDWAERLKESSAVGQRFAGERLEQVRHLMDEAGTEVQRRWNGWRQQWQEMRSQREDRSNGNVDAGSILGKRADQTVTTEGGETIVREGEVITSEHIQRARETHKLYALFLVAAMREIKQQMAEVEERFGRT